MTTSDKIEALEARILALEEEKATALKRDALLYNMAWYGFAANQSLLADGIRVSRGEMDRDVGEGKIHDLIDHFIGAHTEASNMIWGEADDE